MFAVIYWLQPYKRHVWPRKWTAVSNYIRIHSFEINEQSEKENKGWSKITKPLSDWSKMNQFYFRFSSYFAYNLQWKIVNFHQKSPFRSFSSLELTNVHFWGTIWGSLSKKLIKNIYSFLADLRLSFRNNSIKYINSPSIGFVYKNDLWKT